MKYRFKFSKSFLSSSSLGQIANIIFGSSKESFCKVIAAWRPL